MAAPARSQVTEPRRFKKNPAQSEITANMCTIPRKKLNKRFFLGEYDATD